MSQNQRDIVLCINKWAKPHFKHEFRDLLNIKFNVSQEPMGTVTEVLCAKEFIHETFGLHYGDDLTEINYEALIRLHREKNATMTIATTTQFALAVGVININSQGKVLQLREKPAFGKPTWIGIAVLEPRALTYFKPGEDIATHTIPKMLKAGEPVYAYKTESPWFDVGNIDQWRRADKYYRGKSYGN
ncbi:unnamed protein product [marine sediment metagenome]|uniref:Nucleotidyl transferase domain-containing protein n=1 Tax=marine sediment metagenome TaxID=412755 RepID=X1RM10_9ZZZZ